MAIEEPILPQKVNIPRGINAVYVQDLKTLSELPNDAVLMVVLNGKPYKITGGQLKQLLIIEGDNVYAPLVDGKVPVEYLPSSNSDINDVLGTGNQAIDKEVRFSHSFTSALSVLDENGITFTFEASESFITAVESRLKNLCVQNTKITEVADGTEPTDAATFGQIANKVDKSTILKIGDVEYDLSENRTFQIPIGSGGYEANVYLSATDSVTAGYKNLLYSPDVSETIKTITANNNTVQGEKYLYDAQIGTDIIPSGEWKFKLYCKLSAVSGGTTTVNIRVFRYDISGVEHDILTTSKLLTNTVNDSIQFTATQSANIACDLTDVIGIQISLTTTRNQNTTFFYSLGDGYAAYITTPIQLRHEFLRDLLWLISGHKGTANFIAMFDEFGNAKESNQINVKNATFLTEYDNGDSGPAKTIDWNNGQNQKITLTANCVLTLPSVIGTGRFQLKVIQDGTGARSLSFTSASVKNPTNFDFASGTANQECIITFYWDGAKYIFLSIPYYS